MGMNLHEAPGDLQTSLMGHDIRLSWNNYDRNAPEVQVQRSLNSVRTMKAQCRQYLPTYRKTFSIGPVLALTARLWAMQNCIATHSKE
jgi:hypothetical protein